MRFNPVFMLCAFVLLSALVSPVYGMVIYFATRSRHYFFDLDAIRVPHTSHLKRGSVAVTTTLCVPFDYANTDVFVAASATSATTDGNPGNNDATGQLGAILEGFANGFDCP